MSAEEWMTADGSPRCKRHADVESAYIDLLEHSRHEVNTAKQTTWAANCLKDWLAEKQVSVDLEAVSKEELNGLLREFYGSVRNAKGELYGISSYVGLRAGLNRYLNSAPLSRQLCLMKDPEFIPANNVFFGMVKRMRLDGRDKAKHSPAISPEDLDVLRKSEVLNPDTPAGLLNKVWFDIQLYFGHRGKAVNRFLKPDSFVIQRDKQGVRLVAMSLESRRRRHDKISLKSHRESPLMVMPEQQGDRLCPVASLQKYFSKLPKEAPAFYLHPKKGDCSKLPVWYTTEPLGVNLLGTMLPRLCKEAGTSVVYTNRCLRLTGGLVPGTLEAGLGCWFNGTLHVSPAVSTAANDSDPPEQDHMPQKRRRLLSGSIDTHYVGTTTDLPPNYTIKISEKWEWLGMDVKGPFPETQNGNCYLLTVLDYYTKWIEACPIKSDSAEEVALTIRNLICQFGTPLKILSQMDKEFIEDVNDALSICLAAEYCSLVVFHPATYSLDTCTQSYINSMVSDLLAYHQDDWDVQVPASLFSLRCREHPTTRLTPFYMMYGRTPHRSTRNLPVGEEYFTQTSFEIQDPNTDSDQMPASSGQCEVGSTSSQDQTDLEEVLVVQCDQCLQWDRISQAVKESLPPTEGGGYSYRCAGCRDEEEGRGVKQEEAGTSHTPHTLTVKVKDEPLSD